jgi:hypothetical protein
MSAVTNIRAVAPSMPDLVGYVEALTADRLLGWAWAPASPEVAVSIELRLDGAVVASVMADLPRADLASNGIGDGRHAYDIPIPPEFRSRTAELRVFARLGDGPLVPIGAVPAAEGLSEQVTKLQRGMEMLLNSQRLIHRNLQTALTAKGGQDSESSAATLTQLAGMQAATTEQLSAVERFVVRLDEQMSRLTPPPSKPEAASMRFPQAAMWALGVAGSALVVSLIGIVRSLG